MDFFLTNKINYLERKTAVDHAGRFSPLISLSLLTLLKTTCCSLALTLNNYLFVLRKQHKFGGGDGQRTLLIKNLLSNLVILSAGRCCFSNF